jgi:opacity protein-like surface antigen
MTVRREVCCLLVSFLAVLGSASSVHAQGQAADSRWVVDLGAGFDLSLNGNVNSGAIGTLNGLATAMLPNPYGEVYGNGIHLRFGGGYMVSPTSEVRGMFTWQSADADLVRLGDIGPSPLYAQYSDYKSFAFDIGYRRYVGSTWHGMRGFGEATIGAAFIDRINGEFAAPQSNVIFTQTNFYDGSAALTLAVNVGATFRMTTGFDLYGHIGLRRVGGLSEVDQFAGTGLDEINNDSARLTFPIVVGVGFGF